MPYHINQNKRASISNVDQNPSKHDVPSIEQMLSSYGGLVYTVVKGILSASPKEEIEECVADTFLYLYEHGDRLDFTKGSIKAYLCITAKNFAYDRLRQMKRKAAYETNAQMGQDPSPSAEELALINVDRDALIDAILQLGDPDTRIIIYRYYLNMKSAEIASLLGMKHNTVDQRARRALKKLAQHLRKGDFSVYDNK